MIKLVVIMQRKYYLFLITDEVNCPNYLSNKYMVDCKTLLEIDEITSFYQNAQELGDDLNHTSNKVSFVNAVLLEEKEFNKLKNHNWKMTYVKTLPPLFKSDQVFFLQQTKDVMTKYRYDSMLIYQYKNFLLNHRLEIESSLVRHVKLGIDVNSSITIQDMERIFLSYYQNRSYRKMRDTYFELKKFRVIKHDETDLKIKGHKR